LTDGQIDEIIICMAEVLVFLACVFNPF